jgi:hypothetical protein
MAITESWANQTGGPIHPEWGMGPGAIVTPWIAVANALKAVDQSGDQFAIRMERLFPNDHYSEAKVEFTQDCSVVSLVTNGNPCSNPAGFTPSLGGLTVGASGYNRMAIASFVANTNEATPPYIASVTLNGVPMTRLAAGMTGQVIGQNRVE